MCGLAGLFVPRGVAAPAIDVDAMLRVLAHRGPDGEGRYASDDGRFVAAFRRLAIIDLETGDQPIVEDGGRRVLMGNGEIYNYVELRARPEAAGYPFRTRGDMESVLPLHAAHGLDFVRHLNGMYALALYEREPHRLVLVRDRLGVKPLYWARTRGGGVLFASEIKALFASGALAPAVDEEAVALYLAHGYVPPPRTLFAGVRKLPPGCRLVAETDDVRIERYWSARPAADLPQGQAAIEDHLARLLADSVRLQLRSDVPVGALLSGGIDSGLMVALAARETRRLSTFTVRFAGAAVDETPLAAAVAARHGTDHHVLDVPAADAGRHLPALAWFLDEPVFDPALLPNFLIERELGRHLKVALNGTGGDELFAGYGRHFPLPVETRYRRLPEWLRTGVIEPAVGAVAPMTAWRLARAAKRAADPGGYLNDHTTLFPPPILALIGHRGDAPVPAQRLFALEYPGPAETAFLYADLNTYLPGDLLPLLDRTSMAVGVEGRVPFLDHRLVEAALAVPPEVRAPDGRQKALERSLAARFLPEDVISAPKRGFAAPVPDWIEAGLAAPLARLLTRPQSLDRGWWSAAGIRRLLSEPRRHAFRLYALVMLELAVRVMVEGRAVDGPPRASLAEIADAA